MVVHTIIYVGFTAFGSCEDGHQQHIATVISPSYAKQILQLHDGRSDGCRAASARDQAATDSNFADLDFDLRTSAHLREFSADRVRTLI
ncbi:hypothetical protein [Streptomyces sp. NPDC048266]|uniref:hypothetical protein n=1 Tax=Streptomyces sp. NPDC048266 TaxID=3155787 RepID=UPI00341001FB